MVAPSAQTSKVNVCATCGKSFGYNRMETASDYKSAAQLIHLLVDSVAKGGNLLLDIGPTADGRIPVIMQERLLQMGQWLKVNGEAIYSSRPWRQAEEGNVRYTQRGGNVYAIVYGWPGSELALAAPRPGAGATVTLLGPGTELKWREAGGKMRIEVPQPTAGLMGSPAETYVFKLAGVQ